MITSLETLVAPRAGRRLRRSSWDVSGANTDSVALAAGESHDLLRADGAGIVRHLWLTVSAQSPHYLRELVLRMTWDGASHPSVLTPLGDFFCLGHARVAPFSSLPFTVVTGSRAEQQNLAALNCWFAMPFANGARITVTNEADTPVSHLYYYVDYDELDVLPADTLRFHAHYRQERPTQADLDLSDPAMSWQRVAATPNLSAAGNYLILETSGRGHYLGCTLSIDHLNPVKGGGWFGEGDDMIFIDGRPGLGGVVRPESTPGANDAWPPTLHGTGTEDYFCAAWGYPAHRHATPFHGVTLAGVRDGETLDYAGKWSMYRFHLADPVTFEKQIRVTIEHGHANCHADDYSSVAYWYQLPLADSLPPLPPLAARLPLSDLDSLRHHLKTR
jgi:hypothetical protein